MNKSKEAFHWIVGILRKNKIPFRITGGLAVNCYGATRKLYDIDIDVPYSALQKLMPSFKEFKVLGPTHYMGREWDVNYLSINYHGQDVDLIGSNSQKIFNKNTHRWENFKINLSKSTKKKVFGLIVPVIPKKELISYKAKIKRDVDVIDVEFLSKLKK